MSDNPPLHIGEILRFDYPSRNVSTSEFVWLQRNLWITGITDLRKCPLHPDSFIRRPFLRRGRWRITGLDLDIGEERSFYWEAMRHIDNQPALRLALFDPTDDTPQPKVGVGPFQQNPDDARYMREVIAQFNDSTHRRDSCDAVGIFPVDGDDFTLSERYRHG